MQRSWNRCVTRRTWQAQQLKLPPEHLTPALFSRRRKTAASLGPGQFPWEAQRPQTSGPRFSSTQPSGRLVPAPILPNSSGAWHDATRRLSGYAASLLISPSTSSFGAWRRFFNSDVRDGIGGRPTNNFRIESQEKGPLTLRQCSQARIQLRTSLPKAKPRHAPNKPKHFF